MPITRRTFNYRTDVYRLYDASGTLLYVGIAANGYGRLETHRREKPWWPNVRRVVMSQYDNRWTALYVEACAIRDEQPLHNLARNEITSEIGHARARNLEPLSVDDFEVA